jgi:hypothetical protein
LNHYSVVLRLILINEDQNFKKKQSKCGNHGLLKEPL